MQPAFEGKIIISPALMISLAMISLIFLTRYVSPLFTTSKFGQVPHTCPHAIFEGSCAPASSLAAAHATHVALAARAFAATSRRRMSIPRRTSRRRRQFLGSQPVGAGRRRALRLIRFRAIFRAIATTKRCRAGSRFSNAYYITAH